MHRGIREKTMSADLLSRRIGGCKKWLVHVLSCALRGFERRFLDQRPLLNTAKKYRSFFACNILVNYYN
ncbi:MAG: hypothetical protein A3K04_01520 [Gallionellales bacterium RBG_16_56_9]|nr:MAG: hypothetical protein A3K04_01520 [Gallionellales bacterium RBG_16_56_9]